MTESKLQKQVLVVLCVIIAALSWQYVQLRDTQSDLSKQNEVMMHGSMFEPSPIIYAAETIKAGAVITKSMVGRKYISVSRLPAMVPGCIEDVIGRECKYNLSRGQVISLGDVGYSRGQEVSHSVAESKRLKHYLGTPTISPKRFLWNDRMVEIGDCWFERCSDLHRTVPDVENDAVSFKFRMRDREGAVKQVGWPMFSIVSRAQDLSKDSNIIGRLPAISHPATDVISIICPKKLKEISIVLKVDSRSEQTEETQPQKIPGQQIVITLPGRN